MASMGEASPWLFWRNEHQLRSSTRHWQLAFTDDADALDVLDYDEDLDDNVSNGDDPENYIVIIVIIIFISPL